LGSGGSGGGFIIAAPALASAERVDP
jgi:hypothetical protein